MTLQELTGPQDVSQLVNTINQLVVSVNSILPPPGRSDVGGPGSSTIGNFALWNNTTGSLLSNGGTPGALATLVPGTGVSTALGINIGTAGAVVVLNGAGGTPSSMVGTNITGTAAGLTVGTANAAPISGLTGAGTGVLTALGVNIGSAGAPILFNGAAGTPSSMVGTNITGTAAGLTAGNVTTNANLTGAVTSVGNATTLNTNYRQAELGFSSTSPVTGQQGTFSICPVAGTIVGWSIIADTGTATVRVWKIASGTTAPAVGNNINTSGVALSTGTAKISSDVTDFTTTAVAANDMFAFEVTAVSGATKLFFGLQIQVT